MVLTPPGLIRLAGFGLWLSTLLLRRRCRVAGAGGGRGGRGGGGGRRRGGGLSAVAVLCASRLKAPMLQTLRAATGAGSSIIISRALFQAAVAALVIGGLDDFVQSTCILVAATVLCRAAVCVRSTELEVVDLGKAVVHRADLPGILMCKAHPVAHHNGRSTRGVHSLHGLHHIPICIVLPEGMVAVVHE